MTADTGVFCRQDSDCWAVGGPVLSEHWNGRKWSVAATPSGVDGLGGVWCPGTDCFAAGFSGFPSAIADRWNGRKWSLTPTAPLPPQSTSVLAGVSCATSTNCFAVGQASARTLTERWQGSKWVKVKSPNPARAKSAALIAVFCLSRNACWAVGQSSAQGFRGTDRTLAEHWNGRRWSIVPTP